MPMHRSASKNVPWTEASKRTVKGDRTANAVTMDLPSEGTSSLSEIGADMAPLRWILRKRNRDARFRTPSYRQTVSRRSSSPKWMEANTVFWRTNAARTTGFSKKGFLLHHLIFAHCKFLPRPTIGRHLKSGADRCALRGVAGRVCAIVPIMEIAAS